MSDGPQSLRPKAFLSMVEQCSRVAEAIGRVI